MQRRTGVIVIGGGLAGMIAAAEAASSGAAVELYEGAGELGGRARTREVQGFAFNQGGHALYLEGALRQALDRFEIGFTGASPGYYNRALAVSGARMHLLPFTRATIARTGLLGGSERHALTTSLRALLGASPPQSGQSVRQYLDRLAPPTKVRLVLEALICSSTYCHVPNTLDAAAAASQVAHGFKGVLFVDGGWGGLVRGLESRLLSLGVSVRTALAAKRIEPDEEGATVRFADGSSLSAAAVVLAVGPADAHRLVPSAGSLQRAADLARPVRMLCLDLGLSKLPVKSRTRALGMARPLSFSVHSSAAARVAPPGAALVHVGRYLAEGETANRASFEELERFADQIQPGWREVEAARQRLAEIVVANDHPQAGRGGLAGRPAIEVAEHRHLFIAGDWVGPEGFIGDAAAASGTAAGRGAAACARGVAPRAGVDRARAEPETGEDRRSA